MSRTIDLHPDEEGPVATTVVVHVPEDDPAMGGPGRPLRQHPDFVFLAIHGWNDYFYQVELARAVSAAGGRFYAVDLRKYGRSLREGQTFGFIRDLAPTTRRSTPAPTSSTRSTAAACPWSSTGIRPEASSSRCGRTATPAQPRGSS